MSVLNEFYYHIINYIDSKFKIILGKYFKLLKFEYGDWGYIIFIYLSIISPFKNCSYASFQSFHLEFYLFLLFLSNN